MSEKARKRRIGMVAVAAALVISLAAVTGCGGQAASSSSAASSGASAASSAASESNSTNSLAVSDRESVPASANADLTIGVSTITSIAFVMTNDLGQTITDIAFCAAGTTGELTYLMTSDQPWENGKVAVVSFEKRAVGVNYDIHIKAGDNEFVLHDLDLDGVRAIAMRMENGVAYATFDRNGSAVSTLQQETDLARQMGTVQTQQSQPPQPPEPVVQEGAVEEVVEEVVDPEGEEFIEEEVVEPEGEVFVEEEVYYDDGGYYEENTYYDDGVYYDDGAYYGEDVYYDDGTYYEEVY